MKEMEEVKADKWFVYILRCADGSLYTGITDPKHLHDGRI